MTVNLSVIKVQAPCSPRHIYDSKGQALERDKEDFHQWGFPFIPH
jgi:hypothetical protein